MPVISLSKSVCPHNSEHPLWKGRGGKSIATCLMPTPYLLNCISVLEKSLDSRHHLLFGKARKVNALALRDIEEDNYKLNMLKQELKRRNG